MTRKAPVNEKNTPAPTSPQHAAAPAPAHRFVALLRSARFPAVVLLAAAALGLLLANSPVGAGLISVLEAHPLFPGTPFELSIAHWVSDGLLAVFFFTAAVELRHELTVGRLSRPKEALVPAIAAAGGVVVPVAMYLAIAAGEGTAQGWPIPTATDIAFALGVLAVFGTGLPAKIRVFLLALAILDDIVGIVFIAVLFTADLQIGALVLAVVLVGLFAFLSRMRPKRGRGLWVALLVVVAVATWAAVLTSGVHATIAGVALGLAMAPRPADRTAHVLEPAVNGVVLPVFAFVAAAVVVPAVEPANLSPAFWGVLIALPVGKIVGITAAGLIGQRLLRTSTAARLPLVDLLMAGTLGGIGFTVSLLLGQLAFGADHELGAEVTLAVLGGSVIAMLASAVFVSVRARAYRRAQSHAARAARG
ncbi:Na+/H+ antiporter NhaA [Microbacterium sp. GXS0129]|uniref:Na+/H+ antiporter NhaA n=1 Tax=Microbacterium sp. GXS0129 TaxID=3377836 RepID=UPI00383B13B8